MAARSVPGIYGICLVQNEEDVIGESVAWAGRFCDRIWVWDLGSSDRTGEVLARLESNQVRVEHRPDLQYSAGLRARMVETVRHEIPEGSWVYILDSDEFVVGDPRRFLAAADAQGGERVRAVHLNFLPTLEDLALLEELGETAWSEIPLERRLRYYQLGSSRERRFIRLSGDVEWSAEGGHNRLYHADGRALRVARTKVFVRHYRYRSPAQVNLRYGTRQERRAAGYRGFRYEKADFRAYAVPAATCLHWSETLAEPTVRWTDLVRSELRRLVRRVLKG